MRVTTRVSIDIATGRELSAARYEYAGPRARAKGGGSGNSTTTNSLPSWEVPSAQRFLGAYENAAFDDSGNPIAMPGNLTMQTAGLTPEQSAAFDRIAAISGGYGGGPGSMGSMLGPSVNPNMFMSRPGANWQQLQLGGAQGIADAGGMNAALTLNGAYLDPSSNPWLQKTFDQAARGVTDTYSTATAPGIMAAAQKAGQFGSSAMDEALAQSRYGLGQNLDNLATNIYGGNYQQERSNQLATQQNLPNTLNTLYAPAQALAGVGAQRQAQTQSEMDTGYANASNQAEWPFNILSGFGSALGQAAGGGGESTTHSRNSTSGMFGSKICSYLRELGLMDDETWAADRKFGASLDQRVIEGYWLWATPLVWAMRRSRLLTALIAPIALSWALTMKARVNGHPEDETLLGRLLLRFGVPFCGWLGRRKLDAAHRAL